MSLTDPKVWRIAFPIAVVSIIILGVIIGIAVVNNDHDDTSLSAQLDKAVSTQGSVRIVTSESGSAYTFKLNQWQNASGGYCKYMAHYDNGSVVVERYFTTSVSTPAKSTAGTLSSVDYYSAANVVSVSYINGSTTYTWHR